jgi:hypothetical protein
MNGKYSSLPKLLHKLIMMRYITEKSDTHKSSIKKPDRKKRYFLQFILLLGLVALVPAALPRPGWIIKHWRELLYCWG